MYDLRNADPEAAPPSGRRDGYSNVSRRVGARYFFLYLPFFRSWRNEDRRAYFLRQNTIYQTVFGSFTHEAKIHC